MIEPETVSAVPLAAPFRFPRVDRFEEWLHAPAQLESMHPRFDVRRAVPAEFDSIYDLVNDAFGFKRSRARYDWIYRRNPYGTARCWVSIRPRQRAARGQHGFLAMADGAVDAQGVSVEEKLPVGTIERRCDHCGAVGVFDLSQLRPTSVKLLVPRLP